MVEGILAYNPDNKRYGMLVLGGRWQVEGFHCGDSFQVYYNNAWHDSSIEKNDNGYVLWGLPFKAGQLENVRIRLYD